MPFGLALPSKKVTRSGTTIYELRCATTNHLTVQDVLPPSIHPDTKQPYRWAGRGHWTRLPVIPEALLDLWQSLLSTTVLDAVAPTSTSWDEIVSALSAINPDCSREEWIMCGMAIHANAAAIGEMEQGLAVWNTWSAKGAKYPGERDILTPVGLVPRGQGHPGADRFPVPPRPIERVGSRPMPDAASLFSPTETHHSTGAGECEPDDRTSQHQHAPASRGSAGACGRNQRSGGV
jgi:Primase C terminal 2 (PriCT-2).